MKFFAIAAFAATALAMPTSDIEVRGASILGTSGVCRNSGLAGAALCCDTDVLGVARLNCLPPSEDVKTGKAFKSHCASKGQQAGCCLLPILGQGLICQKPAGTGN